MLVRQLAGDELERTIMSEQVLADGTSRPAGRQEEPDSTNKIQDDRNIVLYLHIQIDVNLYNIIGNIK